MHRVLSPCPNFFVLLYINHFDKADTYVQRGNVMGSRWGGKQLAASIGKYSISKFGQNHGLLRYEETKTPLSETNQSAIIHHLRPKLFFIPYTNDVTPFIYPLDSYNSIMCTVNR